MFESSRGVSGWWVVHGCEAVWHASVCRTPMGGDMSICMKTLFLRFLTAPVTSKLEPAGANEYVHF